jgi:hypothetical protein
MPRIIEVGAQDGGSSIKIVLRVEPRTRIGKALPSTKQVRVPANIELGNTDIDQPGMFQSRSQGTTRLSAGIEIPALPSNI